MSNLKFKKNNKVSKIQRAAKALQKSELGLLLIQEVKAWRVRNKSKAFLSFEKVIMECVADAPREHVEAVVIHRLQEIVRNAISDETNLFKRDRKDFRSLEKRLGFSRDFESSLTHKLDLI